MDNSSFFCLVFLFFLDLFLDCLCFPLLHFGSKWDTSISHHHCEYDISCTYWMQYYRLTHAILLRTIDTDTIPIVVSVLSELDFTYPVDWIRKRDEYIDCHLMTSTSRRSSTSSVLRLSMVR